MRRRQILRISAAAPVVALAVAHGLQQPWGIALPARQGSDGLVYFGTDSDDGGPYRLDPA